MWPLRILPGSRGKSSGRRACSLQVGQVLCSFSHDLIQSLWKLCLHSSTHRSSWVMSSWQMIQGSSMFNAFDLECPWAPTLFQTWVGGPVEWTEAGESERKGVPAMSPLPALLSCSLVESWWSRMSWATLLMTSW